ncbi:porphobilinogen synthase [Chengkuizengella sediminis]|uniref:porphobilinogen synthase n=1 Tax=Chengkuizengella sediminis TaxID=1885917 RepID=UPI00138A0028|nr:porphobilinogen synthase [Chengkuizengella sediminis]NDI36700.1 porphobilinogen synthase [Chengkuizengella sediminis]
MAFPTVRHRRLRNNRAIRNLVKENHVTVHDLIYPIFVTEGEGIKNEIPSMPGVYHFSLDQLETEIKEISKLGLQSIILFGVPSEKDNVGTQAYNDQGIVQKATRLAKRMNPNLLIMADTCLCQFMDHGHCGIVKKSDDGKEAVIENDSSLELLVKTAVSQAKAGADVIAPSNMMDGFVTAIRSGLDESGFEHIPIMSYAVKYSSAFYGPFRDAAHSSPQFGDRKTYQMDPANASEGIREAESDVMEGADILMVKPGMAYMDIILSLKQNFDLPIAAYNVSAEYSMIKAAAEKGWIDEKAVAMELLVGFKRAGADMILTYFAKDVARWLRTESI